ncbi:MAG TPA: helix-turn-helix domain-containing protein [Solirubrobacteraceae bacterium]|nr:helix-turn-helix domain-containing protein [Solirubrobacteraceae bacterium]
MAENGVQRTGPGREFSRALMGARYRFEVAAAIARGKGPFWSTQLATELGLPLHYVTKEVRALAAAGLVEPIETPGDRRQFYRRVESTFWPSVTRLNGELNDPGSDLGSRLRGGRRGS